MDVPTLGDKMKKKTLYYLVKYDGKYYAPYMSYDAFTLGRVDIKFMLTTDKSLALRFGTRHVAEFLAQCDADARDNQSFDLKKIKVVRVFSRKLDS